jgi:hypothetical protein
MPYSFFLGDIADQVRSLFMWYMWRIENVDVEAMQK